MIRIADDKEYIAKINQLIEVRANKGKKDWYFNPHKKNF